VESVLLGTRYAATSVVQGQRWNWHYRPKADIHAPRWPSAF